MRFPEEERLKWLPMLLDAYFIADRAIAAAIARRERRGERLACAKGCSNCCHTHTTIPVYPLELVGIYWYVVEKLRGPVRDRLKARLRTVGPEDGCPFLLDGACSIHPMRPLACRHFNVFNRPCGPGEDPYYTRRGDILRPDQQAKERALAAMLPFHGIRGRSRRKQALRSGLLDSQVQNLREMEWRPLALRMDGRAPGWEGR